MKTKSTVEQMVEDLLKSGMPPIVFDYRDVVFFRKESHVARTFMDVNSLELGKLTLKEYRFVARRTEQGERMVKRHIERIVRLIPKLMEKDPRVELFTVPVYPKLIVDGTMIGMLYDVFAIYSDVHPSKLCLEISSDILFDDINVVKERLNEIHELGVKIALSEVGDEYCPAFKMSELWFDMIFLDRYTTEALNRPDAERVLDGVIKYLRSFGAPVIAPDLETEEQIRIAKTLECDGYSAVFAEPLFKEPEPEPEPIEEPAEETTETPAEETAETPAEEPTETPAEETTETPAEEPTETPAEETAETPVEEPAEEPTEEPEPEAEPAVYLGAYKLGVYEKARKTAEISESVPTAYRTPPRIASGLARRDARRAAKAEGRRNYRERISCGRSTERRRNMNREP